MKYLDTNDSVASYAYESIKIPYISNNTTKKVRNYYPDILVKYVDGSIEIVEIKPSKKLQQAVVKKKLKAGEDWCNKNGFKFVVITEHQLKNLNVI